MAEGVVSELAVLFRADTSALEKGLARAQKDIKDTGDAANKGGGMIGGLVGGLGKLGLAGLGIGAIKGAVSGVVGSFGDLIGAAESAGDAKARLDGVLGSDLSGVIQDNATIANSLGMTKTAYLEAAGSAANYLVNLGLSKDAAAEMAVGMADLAPKLAAFTNMDPSAVTDALQKGVGGSTRGLKELGIVINDDLLKGLDNASKSAEIFRQIQEQSGPASAAWADNQTDVAHSMARVSAAMDDAKAAIGERLLPIIAPLVQWFADKLPGAIDMAAKALGPVLTILSDLGSLISGTLAAPLFDAMKGGLDVVSGALAGAMGGIKAFGEGFNADFKGADTLDRLSLGFGNLAESLPEGPVKSLAGWLSKLVDPFKGETALEKFFDTVGGMLDGLRQAVSSLFKGDLGGAMDELGSALGIPLEILGPLVDMFDAASSAISDFIEGFNLEPDMSFLDRLMNAFGNVSAGAGDVGGFIAKMADGFAAARPGIEAFIAAVVDRFTYFKDEILPPVIAFITGTLIPAFADFGQRAAAGFAIVAPFVTTLAAEFMQFGNVVIESVWPIVKKVFDFIGEHSGVFVTIGAVIAVLAGGPITMLIGALALIGTIVPSVIAWFDSVKAKVAEMSDAIGARVTEIAAWWQNVKDSTAAAWQAVKDGVAAAVQFVLDWIKEKFQAAKDFIKSIHDGIKDAIMRVWMAIPADIRARLVEIYNNVVTQFEAVRTAIVVKWEAIKAAISDAITGITDWIKAKAALMFDVFIQPYIDLGVAIAAKFEEIKAIVVEKVSAFIEPIRAKWNEIKAAVVDKVAEIVDGVRTKFAEFKAAITDKLAEAKTAASNKASEILAALLNPFKNIMADITRVGADLLAGLRKGISDSWTSFKDWFWNKIRSIVGLSREATDSHSPSQEFVRLGEDIVAGLRIGLVGLKDIAVIIQEVFTGMIGSADVENFEMIRRLTSSLLGIFQDAADGIRSLLSFDIVTTTDQIKAAFGRLVDVFMVAVGQMAELSKAAGQGTKPGNEGFINLDHINNIERFTGAIQNTLNVAAGTVDILEKLSKLTLPGAGAITALIPFLQEIANAAAVFEKPLGQDEDAIAVFERGSIVAGHIATFAKNVADLTSIKFGAISATFADEVKAAAVAAGQAWAAVETAAAFWGEMPSLVRDSLLVGVKAYAEAVGAAVSILKGAGELDLSKAVFATADLMGKAAKAASDAVAATAAGADWWVRNAEAAAKIVVGVKAYGEAVGAAVGMLATAGGLALDKAVFATDKQLHDAADVGAKAYAELLRVIGQFVDMGVEARTKLVGAVRDYADATSAAAGMLGAAGALDFSKAVFATDKQLHDAADVAARALAELQRVIGEFGTMGHEASGPLVQSIKDFAEGAGAAIDLLTKGAGGINALGEIKSLAGVQPGLIRAVLGNLKLALDTVLANLPTFKPEQLARLKDMGDMAGVFDPLAKAATGINALGAIKSLAGVQPRMIRAILGGVNLAVKEVSAGAGTFEEGAVAKVKAWGEASAATLGALTTAADGLTKLGGKITIPEDLSARVAMLVSAMRTVVQGMAAALSGDGAISVDVAKAGADVAEAVGRIGEAFAPIFDAINAALASPFGRIKAKGQRGDTFRQNIADRIKASLVAAVTALSEALASMPAIEVPDTLLTGVERLATVYDRILDILGKLDGIKIDAKALAALAAVPGILAGGLTGMNVQGSGGTLTMSGGASGGGITINNTVTPTFMPMPTTINNTITAPITVGPRVVQAIAVEVVNQFDTEIKLKPSGP